MNKKVEFLKSVITPSLYNYTIVNSGNITKNGLKFDSNEETVMVSKNLNADNPTWEPILSGKVESFKYEYNYNYIYNYLYYVNNGSTTQSKPGIELTYKTVPTYKEEQVEYQDQLVEFCVDMTVLQPENVIGPINVIAAPSEGYGTEIVYTKTRDFSNYNELIQFTLRKDQCPCAPGGSWKTDETSRDFYFYVSTYGYVSNFGESSENFSEFTYTEICIPDTEFIQTEVPSEMFEGSETTVGEYYNPNVLLINNEYGDEDFIFDIDLISAIGSTGSELISTEMEFIVPLYPKKYWNIVTTEFEIVEHYLKTETTDAHMKALEIYKSAGSAKVLGIATEGEITNYVSTYNSVFLYSEIVSEVISVKHNETLSVPVIPDKYYVIDKNTEIIESATLIDTYTGNVWR